MLRTCLRLRPLATRLRQAPAKRRFGIANMLPDMLTHLPAPSDPMFAVLCLSGAQVVMGAFGQSVMHAFPLFYFSRILPLTFPPLIC